ncbi:MAG: exopolysaccharide Pel transporter PelG [Succinivibrio dextrinosolvens]|nr:exopolysaccharide Pel transporter PelG [Succinivibrio dextrinosolvens]
MAGIGFELRKILKKDSLTSVIQAYGIASIVSSGPWVLSIMALMIIGIISIDVIYPSVLIIQFLISVTYMMAGSLILSGFLQILFSRLVADCEIRGEDNRIIPNLFGAMLFLTAVSGAVGFLLLNFLPSIDFSVRICMLASFVLLTNQWIVIIFLSGMKEYYRIVITMFAGYGLMVFLAWSIPPFGLLGLEFIFCVSQGILTFAFLLQVVRSMPGFCFIRFDFLNPHKVYVSLVFCGLFYNLGVWADKFVFWFRNETSYAQIDVMRASYIYDLPIFLAYLAVVPGMAVFIMRIETDFTENCFKFYNSVREGGSLSTITLYKDQMIESCRKCLYKIFKVQGITLALLLVFAKDILSAFGIDLIYLNLFYIDLVGVSLQVLVMSLLNVMYYLDKRYGALILTAVMVSSNFLFSYISIDLGPVYYGYGFAFSMLLCTITGLFLVDRQFSDLEYQTFMLQKTQ